MDHGQLPSDVTLHRTTDTFTDSTVPAGLLKAHRVATGVWGCLKVGSGRLRFVWEDGPGEPLELSAGDSVVIPPDTRHHVEPMPDCRFAVEFYR